MLESSFTLPCGVTIKNRIAKAAMSENMASTDHVPKEPFEKLYTSWANGGSGIVITGNVMINSSALGEPYNVVIEKGHDCLNELKAWANAGTQNGTSLWMQINHPGKQSPKFLSPETKSPSAIGYGPPMDKMFGVPKELTEEEILDIIERFAFTAKVAKEAGFSGVQIHGAHGYLVSQFLSPKHNQRSDRWGGSFENRIRFPLQVYKRIREEVGPEFPVGIKLNSADFQKGGFTNEESMEVIKILGEQGIDLFEISGGTYEAPAMTGDKKHIKKESTKKREAYFLDYCEKLRSVTPAPLMLTGGFRSKTGMEEALESKACDMIGVARALAIDPEFPNKLLKNEDVESQVKPLSSGIRTLDKIVPLEITWYTQQLHRMGNGLAPNPTASVKMSILKTICEFGIDSIKRVRAK